MTERIKKTPNKKLISLNLISNLRSIFINEVKQSKQDFITNPFSLIINKLSNLEVDRSYCSLLPI